MKKTEKTEENLEKFSKDFQKSKKGLNRVFKKFLKGQKIFKSPNTIRSAEFIPFSRKSSTKRLFDELRRIFPQ